MDQSGQDDERADALSGLFALLTAKLEDGAALAANGQAKVGDTALLDLARRIHKLTSECTTISDPPVGAKKGVQQSDVYQLMAYARIYRCDRLMLLYPAEQEEDTGPIEPFGIDGGREMLALRRIALTADSGAAITALCGITRYLLDGATARSAA